ncbi:hypothetical protein ENH_00032620 [Eimeria necatrix]|uniref:YjeF N-terminal domain-containing protein n=1 Tax=Eimeria necatrix TaxID=51315 RepID=U6MG31_9EIME|nr:hypothetical protein ENH_00032620 [Eimeria necatrix]CDJ62996.1 hypothetical protein ENH_00032620 [Eimeria necatrix]
MSSSSNSITYLSAAEAQKIDEELMGPEYQYDILQLMELAGLSVASAVFSSFCELTKRPSVEGARVLVLVGPGKP